MTRSDIGVIAVVYAICLLFLYMTVQLKAAAQIYPLALIAIVAILDTLYLIKCLYKAFEAKKAGKQGLINDLPQLFNGFMPRQFFFVATACIAYMALLRWLGFYLTSFIFLVGVMLWLKVKISQMCITILILGVMVYGVFTLFLNVPLPRGILFG